MYKEDEAQI